MKNNLSTTLAKHVLAFVLVMVILFQFSTSYAQIENMQTEVITASQFNTTRPLREIFADNPVPDNFQIPKADQPDKRKRIPQEFPLAKEGDPIYGNNESTIQRVAGEIEGSRNKVSWAGQNGGNPSDPSGAIGPNHYIQMVNSTTFRVFNKATGAMMLTGILGNLWTPATGNNGDPIVMYDKAADRWFLAQFGNASDKKIYIAVSQTSDPLGSWHTYTYIASQFPDYLKFGVWQDAYYMTSHSLPNTKVYAFNRAEILAGTSGARAVGEYIPTPQAPGFFCPLPADAGDGILPPTGTPCPISYFTDNGWGALYNDAIQIYNMSVNWVPTIPTANITLAADISTAAFNAHYDNDTSGGGLWQDCPQPGTTQKVDGIGGVLMYRSQYKRWAGYNTLVLNWAVEISSTQRGIKWCELRQTGGVWSMYQEGIYAPGTDTRWLGSIAMNNDGAIGLCYIRSNATSMYPSLYYTGRRQCDPLGTLPIAETLVASGVVSKTSSVRVGDYSQLTIDPTNGTTFWGTSEYFGGTSGTDANRTHIFSFDIPSCFPSAGVAISITGGVNSFCKNENVTLQATPTNGGTSPVYQWKINGVNVGTNSSTFSSNTFNHGDIITCIMTSNLPTVIGNPATSNAIAIQIHNNSGNVNAVLSDTTVCQGSLINIQASSTYCIPSYNLGTTSGDYISHVQIGYIDNYTGASAAPYYSQPTYTGYAELQAGSNFNYISIYAGPTNSNNYIAAWIDFNNDNSFDPSERIGQSSSINIGYGGASFNFPVPLNAVNGSVRLRTRLVRGNPNIDPCSTENYGETKDYHVFILGGTGNQSTPSFTWTSINTSPTSGALVFSTPLYSQAYTVQSTDAFGCTSSFTTPPVLVNSFNLQATSSPNVVCQGNAATLTVNTASNYCQPIYFNGTNLGDYISQIALWDQTVPPFGNFILSNNSGASSSPYYNLFPASGNTTATLQAGNSYTFYLYGGNSPGNSIAAFIDYNGNGNLDAGLEKIGNVAVAYPNASALTFTVPTWAHNGTTRLRLRLGQGSNIQSCSSYDWGETEDYIITITGGVTPAPYSYAWSPTTNPITANTVSAIPSTSTEYAVVATDAIGCTATTKTSVMVATPPGYSLNNPNPLWICAGDTTMLSVIPNSINYCEPTIANGTGLGDFISNVTIQGTTLSNTTGASSSPYRTLYPQSGNTTATLASGSTYLMYVSNGSFTSYNNISAWIDYDGDGIFFEATEKIGESGFISGAYGVGTISFKIPTWAKNGTTRLRVREAYGNLDLEACNSTYPDGELEDYLITITGGVAPTTYSWNPLGGSSTSASTFIMPTYTQTYTLTASDGYNCANTATITAYVNSPVVQASASPSSICEGAGSTISATSNYCQPTYSNGNNSGDFIEAVSLDGTSLNNTSGANTTSYTLYNAAGNTTTTLTAGNTYTLTVTVGLRNVGNTFAAWMDFDRNHELNNGFEKLGEVYNLSGNATASIIFTIPAWANDGISRLRISETYFTPGILPCGTNMYGETEDYPITITGGLYAPAPTYVWNDALNTSASILNATPNYSTQYIVTATDVNGCTKTSSASVEVNSVSPISISASPTSICAGSNTTLMANYTLPSSYCTPQTFNGNSGGNFIHQVSIQGTTLNNTTGANPYPFYNVYPASGSTTATLTAGNTYSIGVVMGNNCCNNYITAWIDYNQNYSFEAGIEKIAEFKNISGGTLQNILFTIPPWAKNGTVRLRVREAFNITNMNACTTYGQGETEDYLITITNGVTSQPVSITWTPTTSPASGPMVQASPTATTTYTATLTDQYGCSNVATQTIGMNTLASFYTNSYQVCVDSTYTFNASPITCSGNAFSGNGTSYGATLLNAWAMTQTSNFTMEAWVKWNGSTGTNQMICYNGNSNTNGYGMMISSANANKLSILCGGSTTLNTSVGLNVGVWQHIVVKRSPTLSGGFWTLYVDGVSYNPSPNTGIPIAPTTGGTYIGRGASGNYFNGDIDEVRFWNTMLSNTQISSNKVGCITTPQSGLVGYWKFNEAIGAATCADASGGNRTLTLSNTSARTTTATYAWDFGDNITANGINTTHNYVSSGPKNVTLTVTDITGCYANDFQILNVNHCYKSLSLKLFLQGFYLNGNQQMASTLFNQGQNNTFMQTDTITVVLYDYMMPQNSIAMYKGVLNTDGTITCNFNNIPNNLMGFYVVIKHRNSLETWSNGITSFDFMNQANYDFTTAANKAFGNNQIEVELGNFAIYTGDINQDGIIDGLDYNDWENDNNNFAGGYFSTDLNGDGIVDGLDFIFWEENSNNFVGAVVP